MCYVSLKVNDARAVAFVILSPTHPHTRTPSHPHTLTPSQYYRTARRRALEATHPDYYSSKRRGSGSATPTSSTPVRPMFTLYTYVIASKHLNNLCVRFSSCFVVKARITKIYNLSYWHVCVSEISMYMYTVLTCVCQSYYITMTSSFIHPGVPISPPPE